LLAHGLLVAAVVGLGYLVMRMGLNDARRPLSVNPVVLDRELDGRAERSGTGDGVPSEGVGEPDKGEPAPSVAPGSLPKIRREQLALPPLQERDERAVREQTQAVFDRLIRNSKVPGGQVKNGPNGDDEKNKKRTGGISSPTKERILRWRITFNTNDGDDYRKQLSALGAILAIPEKDGQYRVIRDLKKVPAEGKVEDIARFDRIFWIDDVPESVRSLSGALQLKDQPVHIVAFFPKKLEDELLRKELTYKNRNENEIIETRFNLMKRGETYEAVVVQQR
jgi:hypothetical protein